MADAIDEEWFPWTRKDRHIAWDVMSGLWNDICVVLFVLSLRAMLLALKVLPLVQVWILIFVVGVFVSATISHCRQKREKKKAADAKDSTIKQQAKLIEDLKKDNEQKAAALQSLLDRLEYYDNQGVRCRHKPPGY